jgi:hypothetical protein
VGPNDNVIRGEIPRRNGEIIEEGKENLFPVYFYLYEIAQFIIPEGKQWDAVPGQP